MDFENLEELLESVLDIESEDIRLSEDTPFPCKLRWIVPDGSYVTKDQIIAVLTPSKPPGLPPDPGNTENAGRGGKGFPSSGCDSAEVAQPSLLVKSTRSGKLVMIEANLRELESAEGPIAKVEPWYCSHEVVVHGLCAQCSVAVEPSGFKRKLDDLGGAQPQTVSPGFITNNAGLEISEEVLHLMECNEIAAYLDERKLCLVLDLDNTLVHATSQKAPVDIHIDTIEVASPEWSERLKRLPYSGEDDEEAMLAQRTLERSIIKTIVYNEAETTFCTSFFKLRPGIFSFFRRVSKKYRLFLFTMGTRQHAASALQILDPQGLYFGNRIFCRNDSRSSMKSLDRIFPKHKNLVLIIDDSEYVWTDNVALIKVHPYYFFSDLTYLNNFDLNNLMRSSAALQSVCNYSNFIWSKLINASNSNTGGEGARDELKLDKDGFAVPAALTKAQFRYNGYLICNERPASIFEGPAQDAPNGRADELVRRIRVADNDRQLDKLLALLDEVHAQFFAHYDFVLGSPAALPALSAGGVDTEYLLRRDLVPRASMILAQLRERVLRGVSLYSNTCEFINLSPRNGALSDSERESVNFLACSDFGKWATKFGAAVSTRPEGATHVVVNNRDSVALPAGGVRKVHIKWLEAVVYSFERVDEAAFDPDLWRVPFRSFWDVLAANA